MLSSCVLTDASNVMHLSSIVIIGHFNLPMFIHSPDDPQINDQDLPIMLQVRSNCVCLMAEMMVNTVVLVLWNSAIRIFFAFVIS